MAKNGWGWNPSPINRVGTGVVAWCDIAHMRARSSGTPIYIYIYAGAASHITKWSQCYASH
jgi:hypothetical protein